MLCKSEEYERDPSLLADLFVITDLPSRSKNEAYSCGSRMKVWCFFLKFDGTLQYEDMSNYMDLEYYRGELSGKKRILKALSNYIKGEIDVGLFANAYHNILCEEYAKSQNPWNITPEGLAAAGIGSE